MTSGKPCLNQFVHLMGRRITCGAEAKFTWPTGRQVNPRGSAASGAEPDHADEIRRPIRLAERSVASRTLAHQPRAACGASAACGGAAAAAAGYSAARSRITTRRRQQLETSYPRSPRPAGDTDASAKRARARSSNVTQWWVGSAICSMKSRPQ
jgi:hypothetical protein